MASRPATTLNYEEPSLRGRFLYACNRLVRWVQVALYQKMELRWQCVRLGGLDGCIDYCERFERRTMPVRIYTTNAGTDLSDAASALLADLIARHGRVVLLAPTFAELDLCRHDAAEAGISLGIDYKTPASWRRALGSFWATGAVASTTCNVRCCFRI